MAFVNTLLKIIRRHSVSPCINRSATRCLTVKAVMTTVSIYDGIQRAAGRFLPSGERASFNRQSLWEIPCWRHRTQWPCKDTCNHQRNVSLVRTKRGCSKPMALIDGIKIMVLGWINVPTENSKCIFIAKKNVDIKISYS